MLVCGHRVGVQTDGTHLRKRIDGDVYGVSRVTWVRNLGTERKLAEGQGTCTPI